MGRKTTLAVTGAAALAMAGAAALAGIGSASAAQADTTMWCRRAPRGRARRARMPSPPEALPRVSGMCLSPSPISDDRGTSQNRRGRRISRRRPAASQPEETEWGRRSPTRVWHALMFPERRLPKVVLSQRFGLRNYESETSGIR
jgi:hypothetical protein